MDRVGTERAPPLSSHEMAEYLLYLGGALLAQGCATHRLESVVRELGALDGFDAQAFAVPTGLFLSVRRTGEPAPILRMVRVKEWAVNLDRLARVDRIFNDVLERKYSIADARGHILRMEKRPPAYPLPLRWVATAGAAGASAVFFRGGLGEVAYAAAGGLLLGLMRTLVGASSRGQLLLDFLGGLLAALLAWGAQSIAPQLSREVLVLSIVVLLVPGMALTTGLAELAHKNLVSGASKLMEAMMIFLSIAFGIAVAVALEQRLHGRELPPVATLHGLGLAYQAIALLVASSAFGVIFSVPRAQLAAAMVTGAVGFALTLVGARFLPVSLTAFVSALAVCLVSNGMARVSNRPAQVFQLPGLILLFPGTFGFLSFEAFLRGEFLGGAQKGFDMFMIAGAIVTGLLLANVLLPARKLL
jgi:uncharacterized membrane protein YjjP (DUF1212 family)